MRKINHKIVGLFSSPCSSERRSWPGRARPARMKQRQANQALAFSPDEMHRTLAAPLPEQKDHDMSFVYSVESDRLLRRAGG